MMQPHSSYQHQNSVFFTSNITLELHFFVGKIEVLSEEMYEGTKCQIEGVKM